jgi:hypothetical protein
MHSGASAIESSAGARFVGIQFSPFPGAQS